MSDQQPIRVRSTQEWQNLLGNNGNLTPSDLHNLRIACYKRIEQIRGRPLIVYATRFVNNTIPGVPNSIDISDIDGFTDLVNSIPNEKNTVDVLIHSPGGDPSATERIVSILRARFAEVHFLIPHSAYSAATMLALSGNSITIHKSGTLGPVDPQINGKPARTIKRGFKNIREIIKNEGPEALPTYIPLLEKYTVELLELCDDAENLSKELVREWISRHMLAGQDATEEQINLAVEFFSDYETHKIHSRPLLFNKLEKFNLRISQADGDLAECIWEAYILINGFFGLTAFVKLYESCNGVSWGRQAAIPQIAQQRIPQAQPPQRIPPSKPAPPDHTSLFVE